MTRRSAKQLRAWLAGEPGLDELRADYPGEWTVVRAELERVFDTGDRQALVDYVQRLAQPAAQRTAPPSRTPGLAARDAIAVRRRMAAAVVRDLGTRAATGVTTGTVRLSDREGAAMQELLFEDGLRRKPVQMKRFRKVWPKLEERSRLMPLVQPQGIYCFWSADFVTALATLIAGRRCLEIGAGDGTLARFLRDAGVELTATDDHSWAAIEFPDDVEQLDARAALRRDEPEVVLCSWPPAANDFEREVFTTPSVETYVAIGNRALAGWGDHEAYARQDAFELSVDERLADLILPPEIEPVVYVFRRHDGR